MASQPVNLTPITAVTAAATKHTLAGARYRVRIKGVSTGHPCPACSDAAVVRCSRFRRPNLPVLPKSTRLSFHRYRPRPRLLSPLSCAFISVPGTLRTPRSLFSPWVRGALRAFEKIGGIALAGAPQEDSASCRPTPAMPPWLTAAVMTAVLFVVFWGEKRRITTKCTAVSMHGFEAHPPDTGKTKNNTRFFGFGGAAPRDLLAIAYRRHRRSRRR